MALFDGLFGKPKNVTVASNTAFQTFTEYAPVFSEFLGNVYGQELTRSSINAFATACSKLQPQINGNSKPKINRLIETQPNKYMVWSDFLERLATIYEVDTTAFIVPGFSADMREINALFPLKCQYAEILEYRGEPWVRFHFANAQQAAIEMKHVCILPKYRYESDFFGDPNCLDKTMQLIHAQGEAQDNAIRNGAKIRFIGQVNGRVHEDELKKKKERFVTDNLSASNEDGILLYDSTFTDVRQVEPQSYVISDDEMQRIQQGVFNYFGVNENILQNKYDEESWNAYYEGKVSPWAVKVGQGLTRMLFTEREQRTNKITLSSSRLDYATTSARNTMIMNMVDRGILSFNEAREMLQLPAVEGGDRRVIRGEYVNVDALPNRRSIVSQDDFEGSAYTGEETTTQADETANSEDTTNNSEETEDAR